MREFGRAPGCIGNVLAVLSDGEASMRATLAAAIELAELTNARLTLVKTCDPGRAYVWVAPFAVGAAYLPPELESPDDACRLLSRLVEQVPESIPVTTLVLPTDSQASLLRLLDQRHFGALVLDKYQLAHWGRLRRRLRREEVQVVTIGPAQPESALSDRLPSDAADPAQVPAGRSRRRVGMRHWGARHLASAGGEH